MARKDIKHIIHQIGSKGELNPEAARRAATEFCAVWTATPGAESHMIFIDGYDDDPREIWEISEARKHIQDFGMYVLMSLRCPLDGLKLDTASFALVAVCLGVGKVVGRHRGNWTVEIGP